ncbi:MAG: Gfo/Idh/MocA family oxidoreductase [Planctomycetaceae bacterium]|nr:Gfo/Idh/MocA family oxidoreductase [Planctomycetaceae bacterium]
MSYEQSLESSPVRFAIIGTAKIARTLAPRIHAATGAQLLGVASRSMASAEAFADEFEIPRRYDSYQAALDDPEIDAVYLPLPPSLHLEWTQKAAAAGKHVLCEKPLARNEDEARQMVDTCRAAGVVLLDGVMWYHTPRADRIRELVCDGELGDIRQMTAVFTFRWDEMPMENLRLHREMGGGSLLDLGWYCVGAALLLLDEQPTKVQAVAQWHNDVDTRMNAFLWFADSCMLTIECGFDTVRRRWFEIAGSTHNLVCDDFTRPWKPEKPRFRVHDNDGEAREFVVPGKPQEECMVEAFCRMIREGRTNHAWGDLSVQTQRVCDALDLSARSQQAVELS